MTSSSKEKILWVKCNNCGEILEKDDFEQMYNVCPKCEHHHSLPIEERIAQLCDKDSFQEYDCDLTSCDPLKFFDVKAYSDRLKIYNKKTHRLSAVTTGHAKLDGLDIEIGIMDFSYIGGSLGSVEGEKLTRLIETGIKNRCPVVIVSASGGARMHESILSLMQMAKTCTAIGLLGKAKLPYISVMTHPTTGGVTASFSMMGDLNIAEPGALIGFAGPRVIKQTIGEDLPEGFQTSEFLLKHGMIDRVCHRKDLKSELGQLLKMMMS